MESATHDLELESLLTRQARDENAEWGVAEIGSFDFPVATAFADFNGDGYTDGMAPASGPKKISFLLISLVLPSVIIIDRYGPSLGTVSWMVQCGKQLLNSAIPC